MNTKFSEAVSLLGTRILAKNVRFVAIFCLFLSAFISVIVLTIFRVNLSSFEDQIGGAVWRFIADRQTEERITIVAIDE